MKKTACSIFLLMTLALVSSAWGEEGRTSRPAQPSGKKTKSSATTAKTKKVAKEEEAKPESEEDQKPWAVELGFSSAMSLHKFSDPDKEWASTFSVAPSYQFGGGFGVSAELSVNQNHRNDTKTNWNDGKVAGSYTGIQFEEKKITLPLKLAVILPFNQEARQKSSFQFGVYGGTGVSLKSELLDV